MRDRTRCALSRIENAPAWTKIRPDDPLAHAASLLDRESGISRVRIGADERCFVRVRALECAATAPPRRARSRQIPTVPHRRRRIAGAHHRSRPRCGRREPPAPSTATGRAMGRGLGARELGRGVRFGGRRRSGRAAAEAAYAAGGGPTAAVVAAAPASATRTWPLLRIASSATLMLASLTILTSTGAVPSASKPSSCAARRDTSIRRPSTKGPRSLTRSRKRPAVLQIGHLDDARHRQGGVGRGQLVQVEDFAVGGQSPVKLLAVPGGDPGFVVVVIDPRIIPYALDLIGPADPVAALPVAGGKAAVGAAEGLARRSRRASRPSNTIGAASRCAPAASVGIFPPSPPIRRSAVLDRAPAPTMLSAR